LNCDLNCMTSPRRQRPRRRHNEKQHRKRGGKSETQPAHRVPAVFPPVAQGRSPGSWDWICRLPASVCLQWHRDRPALTYRCGGSTGLGAVARLTCFPFHPPAGSAGGHLERVQRFYTVSRAKDKNVRPRMRANRGKRTGSSAPCSDPQRAARHLARRRSAGPARRASGAFEILSAVNEIGRLIHHGKSIESCLLLLDLSRFLKL